LMLEKSRTARSKNYQLELGPPIYIAVLLTGEKKEKNLGAEMWVHILGSAHVSEWLPELMADVSCWVA